MWNNLWSVVREGACRQRVANSSAAVAVLDRHQKKKKKSIAP